MKQISRNPGKKDGCYFGASTFQLAVIRKEEIIVVLHVLFCPEEKDACTTHCFWLGSHSKLLMICL